MAFDFSVFNDISDRSAGMQLDEQFVDWLVREQAIDQVLHYEKLWAYYHNEARELMCIGSQSDQNNENSRPYRQAQEYGLPSRISGVNYSFYGGVMAGVEAAGVRRKEVVVENDIAWRIDTLVDFLFGKRFTVSSCAEDVERSAEIQQILRVVFEANGGAAYFQSLALLGSIYGFVDVILRWNGLAEESLSDGTYSGVDWAAPKPKTFSEVLAKAEKIILEAIEAPRSLPILDEDNYRKINFYIQHYWQQHNKLAESNNITHTFNSKGRNIGRQKETHNVEVMSADYWQRYQDRELIAEGVNPLGVLPIVHIQNTPLPLHYEGRGDVEPLIPLQDELNTRLSDRANRITFQSFKMYLGKGIEGFEDRAVAPGRMWSTENPEAHIDEFGGDSDCPSEEKHISHVKDAMEKASGVASVAAGILRGRVGNLTSAVALKITLMGVLAKTERKRQSYGKGISDICKLILLTLDRAGIYPTSVQEREVEIHWPSPLPENLMEKLQEAQVKKELGIPQEQILKELGY